MAQTGPSAPLKFLLQTRARTLAIAFVPIVLTIAVSPIGTQYVQEWADVLNFHQNLIVYMISLSKMDKSF